MLNTQVRVTGAKEIDEVFKGLPLQVSHKVLQAAHADAARVLVDRAKTLSPNGRTFNLEKSIGVEKTNVERAGDVGEIYIGPRRTRYYRGNVAHLIEYGTQPRRNKAGAFRGKVMAKPFMFPAWEQTKEKVLGAINDSIGKKLFAFMKKTIKNA